MWTVIPNQLVFWVRYYIHWKHTIYALSPSMAESIDFPLIQKWKQIVNSRIFTHEAYFLTASEEKPVVKLTLTAFANYSPANFWSLTWNNPDLVPKIRTQIHPLVNAGLRGSVPWLQGTNDIARPLCKVEPEGNFHFMSRCNIIEPGWNKFWEKLLSIVHGS